MPAPNLCREEASSSISPICSMTPCMSKLSITAITHPSAMLSRTNAGRRPCGMRLQVPFDVHVHHRRESGSR